MKYWSRSLLSTWLSFPSRRIFQLFPIRIFFFFSPSLPVPVFAVFSRIWLRVSAWFPLLRIYISHAWIAKYTIESINLILTIITKSLFIIHLRSSLFVVSVTPAFDIKENWQRINLNNEGLSSLFMSITKTFLIQATEVWTHIIRDILKSILDWSYICTEE